jgi:hypothetical protein
MFQKMRERQIIVHLGHLHLIVRGMAMLQIIFMFYHSMVGQILIVLSHSHAQLHHQ